MPTIIRLGDPTSHGGKVSSARASHITVDGIAIACVGDSCTCPIRGHSGCTVAEGNPHHTVDGVPVAYEGNRTTCGAVLIATAGNFCST